MSFNWRRLCASHFLYSAGSGPYKPECKFGGGAKCSQFRPSCEWQWGPGVHLSTCAEDRNGSREVGSTWKALQMCHMPVNICDRCGSCSWLSCPWTQDWCRLVLEIPKVLHFHAAMAVRGTALALACRHAARRTLLSQGCCTWGQCNARADAGSHSRSESFFRRTKHAVVQDARLNNLMYKLWHPAPGSLQPGATGSD